MNLQNDSDKYAFRLVINKQHYNGAGNNTRSPFYIKSLIVESPLTQLLDIFLFAHLTCLF